MDEQIEIDISGLDECEVIAALHNGTRPLGMGFLHDIGRITPEQVRDEIKDIPRHDGAIWFDYYHGRPLKVAVGNGKITGVRLYDRDAGRGACAAAVDSVRKSAP